MTVSYADLNVDTQQGAKVLYARLRQAAHVVCSALNSRDLRFKSEWQRCYDSALSSAVGQVNRIAVTQLYQASVAPKAKS
jgi:UrcA family protein